MDVGSDRVVAVHNKELSRPEDEMWQSYFENPLTAATKAMMSVNGGDEDGTAVLERVYHHYKPVREKRYISSSDSNTHLPQNCTEILQILDLQNMNPIPVNLSLHNPTTAVHLSSEHRARVLAANAREDKCKTAGYTAWTKLDDMPSLSMTGIPPNPDNGKKLRVVYDHNSVDSPLTQYFKHGPESSPDNISEDAPDVNESPLSIPVDGYHYSMDASLSQRSRQADGAMAYLNRGQFYPLTLSRTDLAQSSRHENNGSRASRLDHGGIVQSVIMVVFGEDKSKDEQLKNWKYWHSRQHTAKQRVLDIANYKESFSTIANVEEIAYNAVSFTWDVSEGAKVFVAVNCLSTDFSCQKGVKGMPLVIQVDTYSYNSGSGRPVHRALAQIKVFCDKGAERKLRDEEKKQLRKRKGKNSGPASLSKKDVCRLFKTLSDLETQPVLFIPDVHFGHLQRTGQVFSVNAEEDNKNGLLVKRMRNASEEKACPPWPKKARVELDRKVLLYVRKECDEVFDALMLHSPTLKALTEAILEKYSLPVDTITKVYQRSKKGLLVNMDDNIVQNFSNEDTFTLSISSLADSLRVTLSEISM